MGTVEPRLNVVPSYVNDTFHTFVDFAIVLLVPTPKGFRAGSLTVTIDCGGFGEIGPSDANCVGLGVPWTSSLPCLRPAFPLNPPAFLNFTTLPG
jgi:hypothetical protein